MEVRTNTDGSVDILSYGQHVLTIDEVSDEDTINLFLLTKENTNILETDNAPGMTKPWTHELLAVRNAASKPIFKKKQPRYKIGEQ